MIKTKVVVFGGGQVDRQLSGVFLKGNTIQNSPFGWKVLNDQTTPKKPSLYYNKCSLCVPNKAKLFYYISSYCKAKRCQAHRDAAQPSSY